VDKPAVCPCPDLTPRAYYISPHSLRERTAFLVEVLPDVL
jgi:hypothetical protein